MDTTQAVNFRQAREFSEIVNATFSFIRQNFASFTKALLFIAGPFIIITAFIFSRWYKQMLSFQENPESATFVTGYFANMVVSAVAFMIMAAVVYQYIALYVEKGKDAFEVGDIISGILGNLGKFVVAGIVAGLAVLAGYIFCVIPGIYLAIAFSLTYAVVAVEKLGALDAIGRSRDLIKNYWWQTFGIIIVIALIQMALMMIIYMPFYILMAVVGFNDPNPETMSSSNDMIYLIFMLVIMVAGYLLQSIHLVALAFQYFNLVERKEGAGLLQEIEQIGGQEA